MKWFKTLLLICVAAILIVPALVVVTSCSNDKGVGKENKPLPTFTLANSIYTSWNAFFAACDTKVDGRLLVDARKDHVGLLEEKWGVKMDIQNLDYSKTIENYGAGQCDAICITNMDAVAPALSRKSVCILPNSTSFGADAMVADAKITDVDQLKTAKVHLLEKSVSEYVFDGCLRQLGKNPQDFKFVSTDPETSAPAMVQRDKDYDAAMLWNPQLRAVLNARKDCHVLFDSKMLPGNIIDSVVMGQDSMDKPGGKEAACLIIDIYYTMCRRLADPATREETKLALGKEFGNLDAAAMNDLVRQTRFFATPKQGMALFTGGVIFPWAADVKDDTDLFTDSGFDFAGKGVTTKTLKDIMPLVVDFCVKHDMTGGKGLDVGYGTKEQAPDARLRFDPTYMQLVAEKK
jgi:NitT/TauT family transport system substrate-binding protein